MADLATAPSLSTLMPYPARAATEAQLGAVLLANEAQTIAGNGGNRVVTSANLLKVIASTTTLGFCSFATPEEWDTAVNNKVLTPWLVRSKTTSATNVNRIDLLATAAGVYAVGELARSNQTALGKAVLIDGALQTISSDKKFTGQVSFVGTQAPVFTNPTGIKLLSSDVGMQRRAVIYGTADGASTFGGYGIEWDGTNKTLTQFYVGKGVAPQTDWIFKANSSGDVYAKRDLYENTTKLSDKYLAKLGDAANSLKFGGLATSDFARYRANASLHNSLAAQAWVVNGDSANLNIDHVWFDDAASSSIGGFVAPGIFHFCADVPFKATGNAHLRAGSAYFNALAVGANGIWVNGTNINDLFLPKAGTSLNMTGKTLSWYENTDGADIGFYSASDAESYQFFRTRDNGDEYWKWQQYDYNGQFYVDRMLLKNTGLYVNGGIWTNGTPLNDQYMLAQENSSTKKMILASNYKTTLVGLNGSIELREKNFVGAGQSDYKYAPSLAWHWGGQTAGSIAMEYDGTFVFRNQLYSGSRASSLMPIACSDITSIGTITSSGSQPTLRLIETDISTNNVAMTMVSGRLYFAALNNTSGAWVNLANGQSPLSVGMGDGLMICGGEIRAYGDVSAYYSDSRLKDIIEELDGERALENVRKWRKVRYIANQAARDLGYLPKDRVFETETEIGLLADQIMEDYQELTPLAPADCDYDEAGNLIGSKTGEVYRTLRYNRTVAVLAAAVTAMADQCDLRDVRIAELEQRLAAMDDRLARLELALG